MVEKNACVLDFICIEETGSDFEGHMSDKRVPLLPNEGVWLFSYSSKTF